MLFRLNRRKPSNTPALIPAKPAAPEDERTPRTLAERIARGHALADAEEQAQRKWKGS